MAPRLIAISGPLKGHTFPLERAVFMIGRQDDSDLPLAQLEVSRRHCEIRRDGERFIVRDLGSRQGTHVNAVPLGGRERILEHTDVLQIGEHGLLFLRDDPLVAGAAPEHDPVPPDEDEARWSTVERRPEDVLYLQPAKLRVAAQATANLAADLHTLLELSAVAHTLDQVAPLAARVIELLLGVLPAERGCILLGQPGPGDEPESIASHDRRGAASVFPVSGTLIRRVLGQKAGLLCTDVTRGELGGIASLQRTAVRSLVCVPLPGRDVPLGVLYFDSTTAPTLGEHHLELVTAAAAIVAHGLSNAQRMARLAEENRRLQSVGLEHGLVGDSAAMQQLRRFIARVAPVDSTVLLRGESGTGKELAARALHQTSARAAAPFIAINCATLSETLLESELFGHEKGAFTGAVTKKPGKLELAHGGTLFLDEVGEIPVGLQAKLLRALQEREIERIGGTRPLRVDIRIIAATNRDLESAIREGRFRDDLYYRLQVITFTMPPLRERREDIPLLARHFARRHGERLQRRDIGVSEAAHRVLRAYDWPGNVRQLGNAIERALVLGEDELIQPEDLPDEVLEGGVTTGAASGYQATLTDTKKKTILDALERAGGDYASAARSLGIHVNSLHRLMRNLGLKAHGNR
jgi:transcriptional regulator with GAF, ATPase, and Fis domain